MYGQILQFYFKRKNFKTNEDVRKVFIEHLLDYTSAAAKSSIL